MFTGIQVLTLDQLNAMVDDIIVTSPVEFQQELVATPEDGVIAYHHSAGRYIRNPYGLWSLEFTPEPNAQEVDASCNHPDHISHALLLAVRAKLLAGGPDAVRESE